MTKDIDTEIGKVFKQFHTELKEANAIDVKGRVINTKSFQTIVDKNIKRLNELDNLVSDEAGVVRHSHTNDNNILQKNIQVLKDMKQSNSLKEVPVSERMQEFEEKEQERFSKDSGFLSGIVKLFNRRKTINQHGGHEPR